MDNFGCGEMVESTTSLQFSAACGENVLHPLAVWAVGESDEKSFRSAENIVRGPELTAGLAPEMCENTESGKGGGKGFCIAIGHGEIKPCDPPRTQPEQ